MFLSASGQLGGAETSLLEILASLRLAEPSWPMHLVVAGEGPLESRAAALGVAVIPLRFGRSLARLGESGAASDGRWLGFAVQCVGAAPEVAAYLGRLREAIRDAGPDLLHTNGLKMHLLGAHARSRARLVWHLHDYLGSRPLSGRLPRWNRARCAAVIANSESVAGDARQVLGGTPSVVAVHNGVDLHRFNPSGDRLDLDAFTGFVEKPDAALRALDIVVHASTAREPFGLVIAEAMACERPVVVSLSGGAVEIVTDGVDAVGHTPGDAAGLAERISELAIDAGLRTRITRAGRATAERSFDRARLAAELVPIYRRVGGARA